ncbi:MAG: hypothetical protein Pg6B_02320 [Candidatus Azobacteroides pseudotrichonymphae]|jgi:hypothetical protein|nr:MAG: hypothetical protein Pg6B_02320 [Candidatus Azobacteroides pseudotrichonymphae]
MYQTKIPFPIPNSYKCIRKGYLRWYSIENKDCCLYKPYVKGDKIVVEEIQNNSIFIRYMGKSYILSSAHKQRFCEMFKPYKGCP